MSFGHPTEQGTALLVSRPLPSSVHPEEEPACDFETEQACGTLKGPQERRGDVASWQSFAERKWSLKHPCLAIQTDGVYCPPTGSSVKSDSVFFVAEPFTGCRPDELVKHEQSKAHQQNEEAYREWQIREAFRQTLPTILYDASVQTVNEKGFMDSLCCMCYLNKNEIAHTTNFASLKELCVLLGNDLLPLL